MDSLINIWRIAEVKDAIGAVEKQKQLVQENYWAKVQYDTGEEKLEDAKIQLFQSLTVTCRFAGFKENDIIEHETKFYDVYSVENFEKNSYQRMKCVLQTEPETDA